MKNIAEYINISLMLQSVACRIVFSPTPEYGNGSIFLNTDVDLYIHSPIRRHGVVFK
jgi:hypothetical protein